MNGIMRYLDVNTADLVNMSEWVKYTGIDYQIAEISSGFIFRDINGEQCNLPKYAYLFTCDDHMRNYLKSCEAVEILICNPHPPQEMIKRQADTGKPAWVRGDGAKDILGNPIYQYAMYGHNINGNIRELTKCK